MGRSELLRCVDVFALGSLDKLLNDSSFNTMLVDTPEDRVVFRLPLLNRKLDGSLREALGNIRHLHRA